MRIENDIRAIVQSVMQEFLGGQSELAEERKRRESLEQRVNELVTENQKAGQRRRWRIGARRSARSCRS